MARISALMLGVALFCGTASAFAESAPKAEPAARKFRVGLGLGYTVPFGKLVEGVSLNDWFSDQVPLGLDAGYLVTPHLLLSVYGQYGFMSPRGNQRPCRSETKCSGHAFGVGVQVQYHTTTSELLDPWVGFGVGYEQLTHSVLASFYDPTEQQVRSNGWEQRVNGIELAKLQAGLNFRVAKAVAFGPFLSYSLGEFLTETQTAFWNDSQTSTSGNLDPALHEWLTVGMKGTVAL